MVKRNRTPDRMLVDQNAITFSQVREELYSSTSRLFEEGFWKRMQQACHDLKKGPCTRFKSRWTTKDLRIVCYSLFVNSR